MKKITAFNAVTQKDEEAIVTIDDNGEFVFTFEDKSFFKLPGDLNKKQLFEALEKEKASNEGQVSQVKIEAENSKKLSIFDDAE